MSSSVGSVITNSAGLFFVQVKRNLTPSQVPVLCVSRVTATDILCVKWDGKSFLCVRLIVLVRINHELVHNMH